MASISILYQLILERIHSPVSRYCGKNFAGKCNLKAHLLLHSGDNPVRCDFCGKKFKLKKYLQKHMSIHFEEETFTCNICGRNFKRKCYLKYHILAHSNPIICKLCSGKKFVTNSQLRRHITYVNSFQR